MGGSGMKVKAIAPWFGSKRTMSQRIVDELGPHRVYWEPFCGSMAVLLVKPSCVMETVNDLHGDLVNLARVIRHDSEGPRLYRRLRRTLMCEALFQESAERIKADYDASDFSAERAYHYFMVAWLGRNGVAGTGSYNGHFCVRFTSNGGHAAKRWVSVIESIPAWRKRLANVTILCRDAFEVVARIEDKSGTAIYVDPPYIVKGSTYLHDFGMTSKRGQDREAAAAEHRRLAELLNRFTKSRVVVSYYDHPLLDELFANWTKRHCDVTKALANQGRRDAGGAIKAPEVLLINGPSVASEKGLFAC